MKKILQISLNIFLLLVSGCKPIGELLSVVMAPTGEISINAGEDYTNSSSVTLTFDSSTSSEMYVTNSEGCESGGAWEAYASTRTWTLGQENDTATVYVKFKDRSQNVSRCYSDTIVHDNVAPIVTNITSNKANGPYKAGEQISIQVAFSESVRLSGAPRIQLATGQTTYATYASGNGTSTLTFSYIVTSGDNSSDLNYSSTDALSLNGGSIVDRATNAATLALPELSATGSLATNKDIVIDSVAPTLALISSNPNPTNANIAVTATFSETVTGFDAADITVVNGTAGAVSGSGSAYSFTVTPAAQGLVTISVDANKAQD